MVRQEDDGIRRYLHLGTGNYNDSTAKIYTDVGLFTCNSQYGADASSLFNVITGYSRPPEYRHFVVAPHGMRAFFRRMIQNETENAKKGLPSGITAKVNSLVDPEIISLLYEASQAGVPVKLVVRGICCLIPGLEASVKTSRSSALWDSCWNTAGYSSLKTRATPRSTWQRRLDAPQPGPPH